MWDEVIINIGIKWRAVRAAKMKFKTKLINSTGNKIFYGLKLTSLNGDR